MPSQAISITTLLGVPLVEAGDNLCQIVLEGLGAAEMALADGDVVVLAQKIVSKAEGRQVNLAQVTPRPAAHKLATESGKDARLVELILSEADEVMRVRPGLIIVRHRLGLVLANAGIDRSNVSSDGGEQVLLLPTDPDASAAALREKLKTATGKTVAVLIIDSLGRAWRIGTTGAAIGAAGLPALQDLRGKPDLFGRSLESSELGLADEIAAAASMLMGQADEATPIVIVRGLHFSDDGSTARKLIRPRTLDLFP